MSEQVLTYPNNKEPVAFTQQELGWLPWLAPLEEDELSERHYEGLVDRGRAKSDYFRLLARDPEVLGARTRTDKDIFYNTAGGMLRAEREIAAAAVSRVNGCIFCASVHSRFAAHHSKQPETVQVLLDHGTQVQGLPKRWQAVAHAAEALTATPTAFGEAQIAELRQAGLVDDEVVDAIFASAFFNWANRLMLSLGEPTPPAS